MGVLNVKFEVESNYNDPDYIYINVKANGEIMVSCEDRNGSEQDQQYIQNIASRAITNVLSEISRENISYKDLIIYKDRFLSAVNELFASKNITVTSFSLMNIVPDENSMNRIAEMDKLIAISKMTPEELAKMQQEAQRAWDALSPEEKARIEAEKKQKVEQAAEQMRKVHEAAMKVSAGKDAVANAAAVTSGLEALKEGNAVTTLPKFCSNCGTPTGGTGKFCSNCGTKLV